MTKRTETMKLALEALEKFTDNFPANVQHRKAITALREALAEQPAQQEQGDSICQEDDGCPTEKAVLQRFWRGQSIPDEHYPAWFKPAQQQEPVGLEPFGYFQYDIRLDAWVQNRINNKGVAFYIKKQK